MVAKLGLVLGGGGGKGAYQIGVLRALEEAGVLKKVHAFSGSSVGALNGVMLLQGDLGLAEKAWNNVSPSQVLGYDTASLLTKAAFQQLPAIVRTALQRPLQSGMFSHKGIEEMLLRYVDIPRVAASHIEAFASCCCIWPPTGRARYFQMNGLKPERLLKVLLATCAIPMVFPDVEIDGKKYCDGGVLDNAPVRPVYRRGCDLIIVVHLDYVLRDYTQYNRSRLIHIMPSENLGHVLDGLLDFDAANVKWRLELGYRDASVLMDEILLAVRQ